MRSHFHPEKLGFICLKFPRMALLRSFSADQLSNRFKFFMFHPPIQLQMNERTIISTAVKYIQSQKGISETCFSIFPIPILFPTPILFPIPFFLFQSSESQISLFIFILFYYMLLSKLFQIILFSTCD